MPKDICAGSRSMSVNGFEELLQKYGGEESCNAKGV